MSLECLAYLFPEHLHKSFLMELKKIGPYEILDIVGRGGMGTVYRAVNKETLEIHAVKVLAPRFADEDHFRGRFIAEIQSLIKLDHPNIVRILSYGQEEGNLYFAMELVEGKSLFQMQKERYPFDWRSILRISKDIASGLRHAHDRGIIHRDLKPGNLLMPIESMDHCGHVKITDFGIAKRFGTSQNTGDHVLGTMDFMSPEQARGEPVTARSDLFSLGCVMYTLLVGKPPFTGESMEASIRNLTRVPAASIREFVPDVPALIEQVIRKLMEKSPDKRFQTALALRYKIEEIEAELLGESLGESLEESPNGVESQTIETTTTSNLPDPTSDSFELSLPHEKLTDENATLDGTVKLSPVSTRPPSEFANSATVEFLDSERRPEAEIDPRREVDYYNTVTDRVRRRHESVFKKPEPQTRRGVVPLLLSLLAVIGLAVFGVWQVSRPPTADALYAIIEKGNADPEQIVTEAEKFLELYPSDARARNVKSLHQMGMATQTVRRLVKQLSVRRNLPGEGRLSEIENQFLEVAEIAENDQTKALAKMAALVLVYESADGLTDSEQKVLTAAKLFPLKISSEKRSEAIAKLEKLRSAMSNASAESDPLKASVIYRSILSLYGDTQWGGSTAGKQGEQLIQQVRQRLQESMQQIEAAQFELFESSEE